MHRAELIARTGPGQLRSTRRWPEPAMRSSTPCRRTGLLEEQDWGRAGTHTESGPYTMDDWLEIYAAHAFDHAEQIRRVRGAD